MENGRSQLALLRALADHVPSMLAYWDAHQQCRFANRAYEKWFGVAPETLIGKTMRDLLGPIYERNRPYIEGALRGEPQTFEREIPDPAGGPPRHSLAEYVPDVVEGEVRGFFVVVSDISALKRADEASRKTYGERVEAMTSLAAGIAHEINNPLAVVLSNLELGAAADDPSVMRERIEDARQAALRAAQIVESMKLLSAGDHGPPERVDVARAIEEAVRVSSTAVRYRARVTTQIGDVGHVSGRAASVARVFASLLVNAAEAGGKAIHVRARKDGDTVVVEIADDGSGIAAEHRERVFEPFFTTKPAGGGMGLGLATARRLLESSGARLSFETELGRGTTFRVELRALAPEPRTERRAPSPAPKGTRARVLVVDDEATLTIAVQRILSLDYEVDAVTSGRAAIEKILEVGLGYAVVVCDVTMPEIDGPAVYRATTQALPALAERFVFITGGAFTAETRAFLDGVGAPTIGKPFPMAVLREAVRARAART